MDWARQLDDESNKFVPRIAGPLLQVCQNQRLEEQEAGCAGVPYLQASTDRRQGGYPQEGRQEERHQGLLSLVACHRNGTPCYPDIVDSLINDRSAA